LLLDEFDIEVMVECVAVGLHLLSYRINDNLKDALLS